MRRVRTTSWSSSSPGRHGLDTWKTPSQAGAMCEKRHLFTEMLQKGVYNVCLVVGGYIKGRFTQKDVDQKAVRYVIPSDMDVTSDSFEFQLTDPAGNTKLPDVYDKMIFVQLHLNV